MGAQRRAFGQTVMDTGYKDPGNPGKMSLKMLTKHLWCANIDMIGIGMLNLVCLFAG